jgi:hypothetical protein
MARLVLRDLVKGLAELAEEKGVPAIQVLEGLRLVNRESKH